jgi:hypothetical protein
MPFERMERVVEPEWLDELPAGDRRAIRSRQDLARLNFLMGHAGIMSAAFQEAVRDGRGCHVVELGAGDGSFAWRWIKCVPSGFRPARVTLVDRLGLVTQRTKDQFAEIGCEVGVGQADVFEWLTASTQTGVISANLFLHHFGGSDLARLLNLIAARCHCFIACEPRRSWTSLRASRLLGLIGCNGVTRHDAVVSVRAGFSGQELSQLWPKDGRWTATERAAGWFSHAFVATSKGRARPNG